MTTTQAVYKVKVQIINRGHFIYKVYSILFVNALIYCYTYFHINLCAYTIHSIYWYICKYIHIKYRCIYVCTNRDLQDVYKLLGTNYELQPQLEFE